MPRFEVECVSRTDGQSAVCWIEAPDPAAAQQFFMRAGFVVGSTKLVDVLQPKSAPIAPPPPQVVIQPAPKASMGWPLVIAAALIAWALAYSSMQQGKSITDIARSMDRLSASTKRADIAGPISLGEGRALFYYSGGAFPGWFVVDKNSTEAHGVSYHYGGQFSR